MQPYSDSSTSHNDTEQFRLTELVFSNLAPPQCSLRRPVGDSDDLFLTSRIAVLSKKKWIMDNHYFSTE